ncbi:hypothetical protein [Novosphingobium mangrovi (ex Huang et al. 2023)]|uniref:TonB C-terminal domain-containing protein n=1 Tax=Novosphingobium mangrovi (ex Huang et al. 2023) TaxID=2976432 RepID=A0ABT2I3J3_9SPHN|nr:hypothetical protein [Novosphingobium mangrovi (ex Huang et al. 2023)]MCT2399377.1 hypothetical protein [Novosphingobium mangrovi (ex Huang et al. 2023)]
MAFGGVNPPEMNARALGQVVSANSGVLGTDVSIQVEVLVTPDGKPVSCRVVHGDASDKVKRAGCEAFLMAVPMKPAKLDDTPTYGVMSSGISLASSSAFRKKMKSDFWYNVELEVAGLPKDLAKDPTVSIRTAIGADGALLRCVGEPERAALVGAACAELGRNAPLPVITDASGEPVPYVRSYNVRFNVRNEASK